MAKRKMISEEQAQSLMSRKPVAKGKKRRAEREHDAELEAKMTDKTANKKRNRSEVADFSHIRGDSLRGVMVETMKRVYTEIWPSMKVEDEFGEPDIEIAEECYILSLTMLVGNDEYKPRKGLKMKEIEGIGDKMPTHKECA